MRVYFSRTNREHMRDPTLYTPDKTWTAEESSVADKIVEEVRRQPSQAPATLKDTVASQTSSDRHVIDTVWTKMQAFPHIFELAAARGELMDYDLNGKKREQSSSSAIQYLTFRRWKVQLHDFDLLVQRGVLEPSTWELLALLMRPHLPKDVLLRQPHVLRSRKTGPEHLPKMSVRPRVQIFPYRSNSKQWSLFFLTENGQDYTLKAIVPESYEETAFDFAFKHLQFQYKIATEATIAHWPSAGGFGLLLATTLLKEIQSKDGIRHEAHHQTFLASANTTLQELRATAVQTNTQDIDEILDANPSLRERFLGLFNECITRKEEDRVREQARPTTNQNSKVITPHRVQSHVTQTRAQLQPKNTHYLPLR